MQRTLQLDIPMGRLKPSPMGNGSLRDCGPGLLGIPFRALQAPVVKPMLCVLLSSPALSAIELSAAESDGEEVEKPGQRFDYESD
jgi:hypothetical protein